MKYFSLLINIFLLVICFSSNGESQPVQEWDDRSFQLVQKESPLLLMFYAPWCGHCKTLEPIYSTVAQKLQRERVSVGRVDATKYPSVGVKFSIRGYPTILFVHGDEYNVTFHKERTEEDIIEFVRRANGPSVRDVPSVGRWTEAQQQHRDQPFFLLVTDGESELAAKYAEVAEKMKVEGYFYSVKKVSMLSVRDRPSSVPAVVVFKDRHMYQFDTEKSGDLEAWIKAERFGRFPKISGANLNDIGRVGKHLLIVALNSREKTSRETQQQIIGVAESVIINNYDDLHSFWQFLWMPDVGTIENVLLETVQASHVVLALEPDTGYYYLPPPSSRPISASALSIFLDSVRSGSAQALGGRGFVQRIKRLVYDIYTTIFAIFQESMLLGSILFGVPSVIITFVCYMVCTASDEPVPDGDFDSELEEEEEGEDREAEDDGEPDEYGDGDREDFEEEEEEEPGVRFRGHVDGSQLASGEPSAKLE